MKRNQLERRRCSSGVLLWRVWERPFWSAATWRRSSSAKESSRLFDRKAGIVFVHETCCRIRRSERFFAGSTQSPFVTKAAPGRRTPGCVSPASCTVLLGSVSPRHVSQTTILTARRPWATPGWAKLQTRGCANPGLHDGTPLALGR